jgi:cardiolipin synthase
MFRVQGSAVSSLQSMFAENWLETSGELLAGSADFPPAKVKGTAPAMVVDSSPTAGRSTRARMLFQTLIACATRSIHITTPYFLPDKGIRAELVKAARDRKVDVRIVVPGQNSDHVLTRRSSRRLYGELLLAGARIFEYQPSMMHAKSLVVDGIWSVVGSTNFDHRSFGLNDEVNLATQDETAAGLIEEDFSVDLTDSREVTYQDWRKRGILERAHEYLGWLVERQQ